MCLSPCIIETGYCCLKLMIYVDVLWMPKQHRFVVNHLRSEIFSNERFEIGCLDPTVIRKHGCLDSTVIRKAWLFGSHCGHEGFVII